jgi:NAD(P)-dependent dehydrogenase (short-subunit alcohol dehydrogenase family)
MAPETNHHELNGKHVIITGGNSGIGLVTAKQLAAKGANVLIAGRASDKTETALQSINAEAVTPARNLAVDLSSLASVEALIESVQREGEPIDVLINNAGCFPTKAQTTEDGFELQIGVNHLAHMKLTLGLLPQLLSAPSARVITVSSMLHKKGTIDPTSFKTTERYNAQTAYAQSKLANVLFAFALARRLEGTSVTSNALHPGGVRTDIVRDLPWIVRMLIGLVFISAERGAETSIMLASDPAYQSVTGRYFDQGKEASAAKTAMDVEAQEALWRESLALLALEEPALQH